MMNKSKKYIAIAFVVVLIVVVIVSTVGILSLKNKPEILQGQAEATEIRISGKLPGRIDKFLVEEGQDVLKGDTLVVINSPEIVGNTTRSMRSRTRRSTKIRKSKKAPASRSSNRPTSSG